MRIFAPEFAIALSVLLSISCSHTPPVALAASAGAEPPRARHEVRLTGIMEAVHSSKALVPQIWGQGGPVTLTKLIPNGSEVKEGDLIAVFDSTQQADTVRDTQAKYDDLGHQVEQKAAQNRADFEKRTSDLRQAEADLAKAEMELKKGPVLADIERQQDEVKVEIARKHVDSAKKSSAFHDKADAAALRILELQRDRQKVALERAQSNVSRMEVHANLSGMVAHQNLYRNNSMGHAQEGDQLYRGQPVVSIFDPKEMMVRCAVGEPDGATLVASTRGTVYVDAYPDLALPAHFEYASPVASGAFGSPIKTFTAVFKLDKTDPRLMPDLSAAVVLESPAATRQPAGVSDGPRRASQDDEKGALVGKRSEPPAPGPAFKRAAQ